VPLVALNGAALWLGWLASFQKPLSVVVAVLGLLGVACSAMIYADTRREFWNAAQSFGKFLGTTVLLGAATVLAVESSMQIRPHFIIPPAVLLAVATVMKLGFEQRIFRHLVDENSPSFTPLNKTARLLVGKLGLASRLRVACGIFGGLILPVILIPNHGTDAARIIALAALVICITGELLERHLFFRAVAPIKMPGGVAA
jgi:formate dehydrogenase iron-sulfur subunit